MRFFLLYIRNRGNRFTILVYNSYSDNKYIAIRNALLYTLSKERVWYLMAAKTTNVYIRVEPEVKIAAEKMFNQLGIPFSTAVNLFLKQVVMKQCIPFELTVSSHHPVFFDNLTEGEKDAIIAEGYQKYRKKQGKVVADVFADLEKDYKL